MASEYVAATVPAQIIRAAFTTLFQIAMVECGDPLYWVSLAQQNKLVDPWIVAETDIAIPPVLPTGAQTGILAPTGGFATWPA